MAEKREWHRRGPAPSPEVMEQIGDLISLVIELSAKTLREDILKKPDVDIAMQVAIQFDYKDGDPPFLAVGTMPDSKAVGLKITHSVLNALREAVSASN